MGTDELYLYLGKIGDNLNYKSLKCMCFFFYIFICHYNVIFLNQCCSLHSMNEIRMKI